MADKSIGKTAGTRNKLKKDDKGRSSLSNKIKEFEKGDKALLKIDPSVQNGMPHPKFHGMVGIVKSKQGRVYKLEVDNKGRKKTILAHPAHLEER